MTEAVFEPKAGPVGVAGSLPPADERLAMPATGWRVADALLAVTLLSALIVLGNLGRMPHGLAEFLAIRVTVKSVLLLGAFAFIWPRVLSQCGLYSPARLRLGKGEWPRLLLAGVIGGLMAAAFPLTSHSGAARPELPLLFAVTFAPAAAITRGGVRTARRVTRSSTRRQIVLVGSGPLAARMREAMLSDPLRTEEVVGFVDSESRSTFRSPGLERLGDVADLEQILMHRVVDGVVICLPIKSHYDEIHRAFVACARVGVPAKYPADLFRRELGVSYHDGGAPTPVFYVSVAPNDYRLAIKRGIDVAGAAVLLVLLSPLLLAVALLIKLTSPGPVLFAHERYGYMKRRFSMLKFRTMIAGAESMQPQLEVYNEATGPVFKIRDDPRITRPGRFLRRSSIDELPQLWHVLTGEMSLVGPRPLAVRDVSRFPEPWLMRRFSMRPGITCLWQTRGRSELGFDRWIALDLQYIDKWSLGLDLTILIKTVSAVLRGSGAM